MVQDTTITPTGQLSRAQTEENRITTNPPPKIRLVAAHAGHRRGILELYASVFGVAPAESFEQRWSWAFEHDVTQEPSRMWVLTSGDDVVGFLGALVQPYVIGGEAVTAHTPCDFMVDPDYRFHGLKLMKKFFDECPNCVTCDDIEATIEVTQFMGAKDAGFVCQYVKPLDAELVTAQFQRLDKVPGALLKLTSKAMSGIDRLLFSRRSGYRVVDATSPADLAEAAPSESATGSTVQRTAAFFEWRYGPSSPHHSSQMLVARSSDGEPAGYAVGVTAHHERLTGHVLDLQVADGHDRSAVTRALLGELVRRHRAAGAKALRLYGMAAQREAEERLFKTMGFLLRDSENRSLLVRLERADLQEIAIRANDWNFRLGDAEASHFLS